MRCCWCLADSINNYIIENAREIIMTGGFYFILAKFPCILLWNCLMEGLGHQGWPIVKNCKPIS